MKHLKLYENFDFDEEEFDEEEEFDYNEENLPNFPTYNETRPGVYSNNPDINKRVDYYFIYELDENELDKYLNKWFSGPVIKHKNKVVSDNIITIKGMDKETQNHLYDKKYNPISFNIMFFTNQPNYSMKCMIHSIDNSSYGIWFEDRNYDELKEIRHHLMKWVDKWDNDINGEEFLRTCIDHDADEHTVDYY